MNEALKALEYMTKVLQDCMRRNRKPTKDEIMTMVMAGLAGQGIDPFKKETDEK
jgi:preprotein translocase subunit Sss1